MTFLTSDEQLRRLLRKEVKEAIKEEKTAANPEKLYTFSETAKLLNKCYNTICNMVSSGRIKATSDGKYISQRAIDIYLDVDS